MKKFTNVWGEGGEAASIKFFAESVLELTNIYSAAVYQHRTLSTALKAVELSDAVWDVFLKIVKKPFLSPMISEYIAAIDQDPIVAHMTVQHGIPKDALKFRIDDPLEKISSRLRLFTELLSPGYSEAAADLIVNLCKSAHQEKAKLRKCADNYISDRVAAGVSRDYLHISAKRAFSVIDVAGLERERLQIFFDYCEQGGGSYEILLILPKATAEIFGATFLATVLSVKEELPLYFQKSIAELDSVPETSRYVILDAFPGSDPFSAVRDTRKS